MTYIEKLARIREKMTFYGLDAMLLLHTDPHQGEYLADHFQVMPWLTGFTGSAGTVVITKDKAGVWTDSRYFIQAEKELKGSGFELMKLQVPHTPEYLGWLLNNCPEGGKVGVDASLLSLSRKEIFDAKLGARHQKFVDAGKVIDEIWTDRPTLPAKEVYAHGVVYAGKARTEKIAEIRQEMMKAGAAAYLMVALDEIAWTFNLRGNDVAYNPVFYSYAIIDRDESLLFIDESKVGHELREELYKEGVKVRPYQEIFSFLQSLPPQLNLALDAGKLSWKMHKAIPSHVKLNKKAKYAAHLKGRKNETEVRWIKEVMVRDGVALLRFFRWIESIAAAEGVSEHQAGLKLEEFRSEQKNYVGPSFHPIVGYKGNGAIVHYRAEPNTSSVILNDGILLVDSGGQYLDGTTDITRTISLGNVLEEEKRDFTLVLKGHIQLALAVFPEGTRGYQLEGFARMPLWKMMMNYGHGTGHGVGFFLNVHEGPQSLGTGASGGAAVPLATGMLTSNEPGLYHEGKYGIRTENLLLCVEAGEKKSFGKFLKFESVTLFPIDRKLIDREMLTQEELNWLNDYHQEVFSRLAPHLHEDEKQWLRAACAEI